MEKRPVYGMIFEYLDDPTYTLLEIKVEEVEYPNATAVFI
jgi:general stress protein 26